MNTFCQKGKLGLFLMCLLMSMQSIAQQLDHVQGELLIQLSDEFSFDQIQQSLPSGYAAAPTPTFDCISPAMNIWRLRFDHTQINEYDYLQSFRQLSGIQAAQFNHLIEERNQPDDPFFRLQWPYQAGTAPNLNALNGWDVTTGGITPLGDTIVLCIIDSGFDPNHRDLVKNIYINHKEIPNNGLDDDLNGYIDDYRGWNVVAQTDNIGNGGPDAWHGTPLCGISGAVGNNQIGVAGINWNVKMMLVVRGNTEAQIIQSYRYALDNRRLYNQTRGQQGAFVVATNASWGLDDKMPEDAPLWCAIYDSLGYEGILNVGATTNRDVDIGQTGDLPTTCPSDFLISVTSLDRNAQKVMNAGYSQQHIDLATFGEGIFTTLINDQYGNYSGTSAAAPHVSALIALMYAAPCPELATLALNDPMAAARQVKTQLIEGATYNPDLAPFTKNGKQLDIGGAIKRLMANCNLSGCYNPFMVQTENVTANQTKISWEVSQDIYRTDLRYREIGTTTWQTVANLKLGCRLSNLLTCSTYEFQLKTYCNNYINAYSESYHFQTTGCCKQPDILEVIHQGDTSIRVRWEAVAPALAYVFYYRSLGERVWEEIQSIQTEITLSNLSACRNYEFQVQSLCAVNDQSALEQLQTLKTSGCGSCLESDYCEVGISSTNNNSWIQRFQTNQVDQYSGAGTNGYSDFTNQSGLFYPGYEHSISLEIVANFQIIQPLVMIWLDLNQDGLFDQEKELLLERRATGQLFEGNIKIPSWVPEGTCRLRVAVRDNTYPACDNNGILGEVEDYCINISQAENCLQPVGLTASVEENTAQLEWSAGNGMLGFTIRYRALDNDSWIYTNSFGQSLQLVDLIPCKNYICQVASLCLGDQSAYSNTIEFTTQGCGPCLDYAYCPAIGNATFEWIESIEFDGQLIESGKNNGFAYFSDAPLYLQKGKPVELRLKAGSRNANKENYFSIWVDFNQNGEFEATSELIFQGGTSTSENPVSVFCNIPNSTKIGNTRMRIILQHQQAASLPCLSDFFGETEDYCINIGETVDLDCVVPGDPFFRSQGPNKMRVDWSNEEQAMTYQVRYRCQHPNEVEWQSIFTNRQYCYLDSLLECQPYEWQIRSICLDGLGAFSSSSTFVTDCITAAEEATQNPLSIRAYPNPFSHYLQIESNAPILHYQLFDSKASLIDQGQGTAQEQFQLSTTELPAGMYLLRIQTAKGSKTIKLIHL